METEETTAAKLKGYAQSDVNFMAGIYRHLTSEETIKSHVEFLERTLDQLETRPDFNTDKIKEIHELALRLRRRVTSKFNKWDKFYRQLEWLNRLLFNLKTENND